MRCSKLRGTFCSLITLATPRQDWTGSNPSRREGGGCGFTLWRSHSCCAVRLAYTQISPGHIWTTLYKINFPLKTVLTPDNRFAAVAGVGDFEIVLAQQNIDPRFSRPLWGSSQFQRRLTCHSLPDTHTRIIVLVPWMTYRGREGSIVNWWLISGSISGYIPGWSDVVSVS